MFSTVVLLLFTGWTITSLFVLRKREPGFTGYRTWGYPYTPLVFLIITGWSLGYTFFYRPWESLVGLGLCALGLPGYFIIRAFTEKNAS
jgi:APA family basic amino acid/polyamine antiporter